MKIFFIISMLFTLSACMGGSNDDGSSVSTYSSCNIYSSEAPTEAERNTDLAQCWHAPADSNGTTVDGSIDSESEDGYENKGEALAWCEEQVNSYLSANYSSPYHTVKYEVETNYCTQ